MIIPTADYDPMFADDGVPFRTKMLDYIRREFADLPGAEAALLQCGDGWQAAPAPAHSPPEQRRHGARAA